MSRPKPTVLLETINRDTYVSEAVLAAEVIYAVYYCGKPVSIKVDNTLNPSCSPKYKKTCFINAAPAKNLVEKLNHQFNTQDFAVFKLTGGEQLKPR